MLLRQSSLAIQNLFLAIFRIGEITQKFGQDSCLVWSGKDDVDAV